MYLNSKVNIITYLHTIFCMSHEGIFTILGLPCWQTKSCGITACPSRNNWRISGNVSDCHAVIDALHAFMPSISSIITVNKCSGAERSMSLSQRSCCPRRWLINKLISICQSANTCGTLYTIIFHGQNDETSIQIVPKSSLRDSVSISLLGSCTTIGCNKIVGTNQLFATVCFICSNAILSASACWSIRYNPVSLLARIYVCRSCQITVICSSAIVTSVISSWMSENKAVSAPWW